MLQILDKPGPYPMVVLPSNRGYWIDGTEHTLPYDTDGNPLIPEINHGCRLEVDETSKCYRQHFLGKVSKQWIGIILNLDQI